MAPRTASCSRQAFDDITLALTIPLYLQRRSCCLQDVGDEPYQANVMKITGNFFIVSCVETIAEGMTLAEKNGISRWAVCGSASCAQILICLHLLSVICSCRYVETNMWFCDVASPCLQVLPWQPAYIFCSNAHYFQYK